MQRALIALVFTAAALTADAEPKNLKVLTGLSPTQLQRTMNFIRGSLGVHCDYCHVVSEQGEWNFASDDKKTKLKAREMIAMTIAINQANFGGATGRPPVVTCHTCHRGATRTVAQPMLPQPQPPFPTPVTERPATPELKVVVDHYATAIGDASKLASRRSKGTRLSADDKNSTPIEIVERDLTHIHVKTGPSEQGINGDTGWVRTGEGVRAMTADQYENFTLLAEGFSIPAPADIPAAGRVIAREIIHERAAWVVSAPLREGVREKLWFDVETGLLLRRQILMKSQIAEVPLQTDYSDYRDAGGVNVPFTIRVSSIDPWIGSTRKLDEVKAGVPIEDAEFEMPK